MKERGAGGSLKGQAGADQVRQAGGIGSAGRENNAKAECETTLGSDDQGDQSILGGGARAGGRARAVPGELGRGQIAKGLGSYAMQFLAFNSTCIVSP